MSSKRWVMGSVCTLLLVAGLLATPVPRSASARPLRQPNAARAAASSLGQYLNPDGSLTLPAGRALSLDPRGYRLVSGAGEAPRFAPASPEAVPGDENWASGLSPLLGMNGPVLALAVDGAGNLYAGGGFGSAAGRGGD